MNTKLITNQIRVFLDEVDAGNTNATEEELTELFETFGAIANPKEMLSKCQVATLLEVSPKTVDYYLDQGYLPKGVKWKPGVTEVFWNKKDVLKFKKERDSKKKKN